MNWWGIWLIAGLDSTMVFFLPLAVDIAVIVLASRSRDLFWVYPIIASAGSLCGAAVTYYVGRRVGDVGLERFISAGRLTQIRKKIKTKGAFALAVLDLVPPPFPLIRIPFVSVFFTVRLEMLRVGEMPLLEPT